MGTHSRLDAKSVNLLNTALESIEQVISLMGKQTYSDHSERRAKALYVMLLARVVRTFRAFSVLIRDGYIPESDVFTRMIFESLVDWLYIRQDPTARGEKYEDYLEASNWKPFRIMERLANECGVQIAEIPEERKREIRQAKERFCRKYGHSSFPDNWSGRNIADRAREVELQIVYLSAYTQQSQVVHGGVWSWDHYADLSDPKMISLKLQPGWQGVEITLSQCCQTLAVCLDCADEDLELRCGTSLETFKALLRDYETDIGNGA